MGTTFVSTFCGRSFGEGEIAEIKEIVGSCQGLSRTELASTVCELFSWKRPNGRLKTVECRQFLEHLQCNGLIDLPVRKKGRPRGAKTNVSRSEKSEEQSPITGKVGEFVPLLLSKVDSKERRGLWYEYIDRYHYLGYKLPFGAQLRYFIETGEEQKSILGCLQFSSPAWKMAPRDRWIQWNDEQRKCNLQKIINNSRFLLLPWVKVKNLASSVLALAVRVVPDDWQVVMVIVRCLWRPWWTKGDSKASVIRRPTGCMWAPRQDADEWTEGANGTRWPLKRFTFTLLLPDFGKSWWLCRGYYGLGLHCYS